VCERARVCVCGGGGAEFSAAGVFLNVSMCALGGERIRVKQLQ